MPIYIHDEERPAHNLAVTDDTSICPGFHGQVQLRQFQMFIAVAQQGSISKAALYLNTTPNAVRLGVQRLESAFGYKILDKLSNKFVPTPKGSDFLPVAERLLRDFSSAFSEVRMTAERRNLRIITLPSVAHHLLVPALQDFGRKHPDILFDIHEGAIGMEQGIISDEYDLAFHHRATSDQRLAFRSLLRDRFRVYVGPHHPLAAEDRPIEWDRLWRYPYIHVSGVPIINDRQRQPFHRVSSMHLAPPLLMNSEAFAVAGALTTGIYPLEGLASKELNERFTRQICIITRRARMMSPILRELIQIIAAKRHSVVLPEGAYP